MDTYPQLQKLDTDAMFLWAGFMDAGPLSMEDTNFYGGQIGASKHCLEHLNIVRAGMHAIVQRWPGIEYPGQYEYEVMSDAGAYIRAHRGALGDTFIYWVANRFALFFGVGGANPSVPTDDIVSVASAAMRSYTRLIKA